MNIEVFRDYCISKKGVTEEFPFDEKTLVFKVMGKMFALCGLDRVPSQANLKCDPDKGEELREEYDGLIVPGYHMSKVHWNTIFMESLPPKLVLELIDHSYELVVAKFTKKLRAEYDNLNYVSTELENIINNLKECFNGKPWYGISMMDKLNEIPWEVVNMTDYKSKSIAVLVQHIINWRIFLLKKMEGDFEYDLKIDSVEDWTQVHIENKNEWEALKNRLHETQIQLLEKLSKATPEFLEQQVPGKNYTFLPILTSISQHDIYHLGQIAMLNAIHKH